jgi:hypothetical protein
MLYCAFVIMMILGFIDGIMKLTSREYKNTKEYNNILDFLLSK